ncbi:hypothetical protein [Polyangium sp. y55x31]|uniref:alpha/beta hydrolase family protein n=1 Tax=Polyangium sp. y55x31 TaxID=3042688 RepID=UPI0024827D20|nr:hypothetical protein [Polyangium sp. y55x31]MDI1480088.1 hypothetical protein [Polyangium sp. y55x31]
MALLVVGTHLIWPRGGAGGKASVATVTYAWLQQQGPHGPSITVDLYAPGTSNERGPLVVFLQGNEPSQPDERQAFAANVGDSLQRNGITVAAVSFDVHEGQTLRGCAADVARIVKHATDARAPTRLVLVGRGLGAWMASMLALDRRLLEGAGMDPKRVDGVILFRGTYDLSEAALEGHPDAAFFAGSVEDRNESSPIAYARSDSPPFLMLSGGDDDESNWAPLARSFARALWKAGARDVDDFVVPGRDTHSILHWGDEGNDVGDLVFRFVASGPDELPLDNPFGVLHRWGAHPPLDLSDLRKDPKAIVTYPVDDNVRRTMTSLFGPMPIELYPYVGKTYQAIDLLSYLAGRPESEVGKGNWLVVSNLRGEQEYFRRDVLEKVQPVIVVGLDDEDNLYRVATFYRSKRAYSWIKGEEPMPVMIRPLGAFLHFRTPLPNILSKTTYTFGLDATSFHWVETDPLAPMRSLPRGLREVMIGEQGCLSCHEFRGIGTRSHHTLAATGKPYGAFALPLEEYPTEVLRRFLFDQDAVAESFGVNPFPVERNVATQLLDMVTREKNKTEKEK